MALATLASIAILLATAAYVFYHNFTKNYRKWSNMPGVPSLRPSFPFGNMGDIYMQKKSLVEGTQDVIDQLKGQRFGIAFDMSQPVFIIRDLELIKRVCITDFWHFSTLSFFPSEVQELECNDLGLVSKVGQEWKTYRQMVSPAFTMKNLKDIAIQGHKSIIFYSKVQESAKNLMHNIEKTIDGNHNLDIHKLIKSFTLDAIAKITCSIKVDSYTNWDSEVVKIANSSFNMNTFQLAFMFPWIFSKLKISILNKKFKEYFQNLAKTVLDQRKKDGTYEKYNDVLAVMSRVRSGHKYDENGDPDSIKYSQMSDDIISKTVMQFYFDGYETTTNLILPLLFILSLNPNAQEKAIEEVDEIFLEHGEELSGNDVKKLKYLDKVVQEVTRLTPVFPPARICTMDWKIPDSDVTIPKGMKVILSLGNQMDNIYFKNPHEFDPDRFSAKNAPNIPSGSILTFGLGPRSCIGQSIFNLEAKILLYHLLQKFIIKPGPNLSYPLRYSIDGFGMHEDQSVILERRKH